MADDAGSTVPRRQLGRMLRQLRAEARMTLDGVAEELECSRQKLWRIETGIGPVRAVDVKGLCDLYGVRPELREALIALAGETRARGWWHAYGDTIPEWFQLYVGLENAAAHLRFFKNTLVPGIFQSRDYAHGVYQVDQPDMSEEDRQRAVEIRLRRQSLLSRRLPRAPETQVILCESVLLRPVGDQATMTGQLRRLLADSELPNVSIRVLPLAAGPHHGTVAGEFVMLEFPTGNRTTSEPPIVYSESVTGALYLDRPAEFATYENVWASLTALALDEGQSRQLINKIIGEVHHG
ncbi:helix-turn-helix domain-containing protein [Micromonospora echinofusca]|uniref:Helix-turn-helix domain-containing protein n=1 Tax=Micromonospora echinofusca TaxID=47858 RepID=A0ABS3VJX2_MICEH|nr:helix-turn-helix transcriptional regulator [Micromonospora echinofusca]MBO4204830.1 helix-turn-helix domain-containing protein [Micromonospora echinofusca]